MYFMSPSTYLQLSISTLAGEGFREIFPFQMTLDATRRPLATGLTGLLASVIAWD
jgi:hypothetical protein